VGSGSWKGAPWERVIDMSKMDTVNISFNWAAAMRSVAIGTVTICALINVKVVGEHNKLLCSPIILVFCAESRT